MWEYKNIIWSEGNIEKKLTEWLRERKQKNDQKKGIKTKMEMKTTKFQEIVLVLLSFKLSTVGLHLFSPWWLSLFIAAILSR